MALRLFFRGDNRHPLGDAIFKSGFLKREPKRYPAPLYREIGPYHAGDLVSESGVCVSARFASASMFPLKGPRQPSRSLAFIYVVCLDPAKLLNTHQQQVLQSLGEKHEGRWQNPAQPALPGDLEPMWPLFGHELAANAIASAEIVSAVACMRRWTGTTWQQGGSYLLGRIFRNPKCKAPAPFIAMAQSFLANEVENFGTSTMPQGDSGFKPAVPTGA